MQEHGSDQGMDLRSEVVGALVQLWRRRGLILAIAWIACLAGWTAIMVWPNRYEARARIYVDADTLLSPLLQGMSVMPSVNKQASVMQRTLLARQNLETVLYKLYPDRSPDDVAVWEGALKALETATRIEPEGGRDSRLFVVSHLDVDPVRAKVVVETLLQIFIKRSTEASRTDIVEAQDFIDAQLVHYEGLLREAEARLADFKQRHVGLLPQNGNYAQAVETARGRLGEIAAALQEAKTRRGSLRQALAQTSQYLAVDGPQQVVIGGTAQPTTLDGRITALEGQVAELLLRYTDKHPDVIAARRLLQQLREQQAQGSDAPLARVSRQQVSNPVYEQIRLKLVDLEAEVQTLERRHADHQKEIDRLGTLAQTAPGIEAEFVALNRDYSVLKDNYEGLLARRESAKMSEKMQARVEKVQFSIIDPPTVPKQPAVPNRPLLLTAVLLAGLSAGAIAALALIQLHRPLVTVQQLRDAFDRPVLGGISTARLPQGAARRKIASLAFSGALAALLLAYGGLMVWSKLGVFSDLAGRTL